MTYHSLFRNHSQTDPLFPTFINAVPSWQSKERIKKHATNYANFVSLQNSIRDLSSARTTPLPLRKPTPVAVQLSLRT